MVKLEKYKTEVKTNLSMKIWKIKKLLRYLNNNHKLLDVGCSSSPLYFAIKNKIKKENYFGIDYNEVTVENLKKLGLNVELCDIRKDEIPFNEKFDIVWMSHVIEHLNTNEQIEAIKKINEKMKAGGFLFIFAPTPYHWYFWDDFTHVRPVTHGSLQKLLENFGFRIIEAKYSLTRNFPNKLQRFLRLPPLRFFLWEVYVIAEKIKDV